MIFFTLFNLNFQHLFLYLPNQIWQENIYLEAEYANREVNLEESESEEENGGYEFQRGGGSGGTQQNGASYETKRGISPEINDSSPGNFSLYIYNI